MARDGIERIHNEGLGSELYREVANDTMTRFAQGIYGGASALAVKIARLGAEKALGAILRPGRHVGRLADRLLLTCKSCTPRGNAEFRSVHSSVSSPLEGLSRWVVRELEAELAKVPWLMSDASDGCRR